MHPALTSRSLLKYAALGAALSAVTLLAACGAGSAPTPTRFTADIKDGKLIGTYNPAGFSSADVQGLLGRSCVGGKLASYGEQVGEGGTNFTATCVGGLGAEGGNLEIEKAATGTVVEATTVDANGGMSYARLPPAS